MSVPSTLCEGKRRLKKHYPGRRDCSHDCFPRRLPHCNQDVFMTLIRNVCLPMFRLTFDTPDMMRVLRFVGVFLGTLLADSVSCRMAVSATGSSPLGRVPSAWE